MHQFFRPESYNLSFKLFNTSPGAEEEALTIPDVKCYKDFMKWIKDLPEVESPVWSGLPLNVEKIVLERKTTSLIQNLMIIQGKGDEDMSAADEAAEEKAATGDKAKWLVDLHVSVDKLLDTLPLQLEVLQRTSKSITNPLFRFLEREVTVASGLLEVVRSDLTLLRELCSGARKSTNILKALAENLHADVIPVKWNKFNIANITATEWVNDFKKRIDQLQKLSGSSDFGQKGLWYGGLLFPEAYMTATQQSIA